MPRRKTRYFVYVIELSPIVRLDKKWKGCNPDQSTKKCFYVGQSAHEPACRLNQHKSAKHSSCTCICHFKRGKLVNRYQIGSARFVSDGNFAKELCPKYYKNLNPISTKQKALDLEYTIADHLRELGHGSYSA